MNIKYCWQTNPAWKNNKLGSCNVTFGSHGCTLCSVAYILNIAPPELNDLLKQHGGYFKGCLMNWTQLPSIFKCEWHGRSLKPKFYPNIAEVEYKQGLQHFVVALDEQRIIDPLTGRISNNKYKIKGYRNLKVIGGTMSQYGEKWIKFSNSDKVYQWVLDPNLVDYKKMYTLKPPVEYQTKIDELDARILELEKQLKQCHEIHEAQLDDYKSLEMQCNKVKTGLLEDIVELGDKLKTCQSLPDEKSKWSKVVETIKKYWYIIFKKLGWYK